MIEIMKPTDFIARLEIERGGYLLPEEAGFVGRDVDFALNMINFSPLSPRQINEKYFCYPRLINETSGGKEYILIDENQTRCFSVNKLVISKTYTKNSDSFYIGIVTQGNGKIITENQEENVKTGDKFFIPHKTKKVEYFAAQSMEIIFAFPPG